MNRDVCPTVLGGAARHVGGGCALEGFADVAVDGDVRRGGHLGPSLLLRERSYESVDGVHRPRVEPIRRVAGVCEHGDGIGDRHHAAAALLRAAALQHHPHRAVHHVRPSGVEGGEDPWRRRSVDLVDVVRPRRIRLAGHQVRRGQRSRHVRPVGDVFSGALLPQRDRVLADPWLGAVVHHCHVVGVVR